MIQDILPSLIAAAQGMTVEQIQEQIIESSVVDSIEDPASLAALIFKAATNADYAAQLTGAAPEEAPAEDAPNPE